MTMNEPNQPNDSDNRDDENFITLDPLPPRDGKDVYPPKLLAAATTDGWDESYFITHDPIHLPPGVYPPEILAIAIAGEPAPPELVVALTRLDPVDRQILFLQKNQQADTRRDRPGRRPDRRHRRPPGGAAAWGA
jgi:hypothetical protein